MKYLHTMLRINDVKSSMNFFVNALGLKEVRRIDVEEGRFSLIFLAAEGDEDSQIELTHNWGTENDINFKHHNGNSDPQGFGHIGFSVPDVYAASNFFV